MFEYILRRADEVPGAGGGGKSALVNTHDYLRKRHALRDDFKGTSYTTLFFLDKDIDDLLGKRKRSTHVVYTRSYDIEGEVFLNGDLPDSVAAACSLDPARTAAVYGDQRRWMIDVSELWRDWVKLCVSAQLCKSRGICNFGVPSRVNVTPMSRSNPLDVIAYEADVERQSSLGAAAFSRRQTSAYRRVDRRYSNRRFNEVFKGKWFAEVLDFDVKNRYPVEHGRVAGFKERIVGHLAQSLNYDGEWAQHYRSRVRAAVAGPKTGARGAPLT